MKEKILLDEELFLNKLAVALDVMGFNTSLVETEGYPLSIETKILGYEDFPIEACLMFLPVQNTLGDQSQALQIYISLYGDDLDECFYEDLKEFFNECNMNCLNGTFGVQDDLFRACYKQGVLLPLGIDFEDALNVAMQNFLIMILKLDEVYDSFLDIVEE